MTVIPETHRDLLERPLFAHVATMMPSGAIQSQPVWYVWDGTYLRMTTKSTRQKARNVAADNRMTVSIHDPEEPYRYLELRGHVVNVEPDPEGTFQDTLSDRYAMARDRSPGRETRIVLVFRPEHSTSQ